MSTVIQDTVLPKPVIFNKTVTADREDTSGYQEIYSDVPLNGFVGATACGLAVSDTYCLRMTIDGTLRTVDNIVITSLMDWDAIAAQIQTKLRALTASTETVTITGGKIKVTSATTGATSIVNMATGLTHLPLIAAIEALSGYSNVAFDAKVDGVDAIAANEIGSVDLSAGHDFSAGGAADFLITVDGGAQKTIHLAANDTFAQILSEINAEFVAEGIDALVEAVADSAKYVKIQHKTSGSAHNFILVDGTNTPLATMGMTAATYTGVNATAGYQTISCTETFVGATVPALSSEYTINVAVDGGAAVAVAVTLAGTETWTQLATALQLALRTLTGQTEVVNITNYRLRFTSFTNGTGSSILLTDGSVGRPLMAAITALANYTANLATAQDGREGVVYFQVAPEAPTTKNFFPIAFTQTVTTKKEKFGAATGLLLSYSMVTGRLSVLDDADSVEVKSGDVITILGAFQ